MTEVAAIIMIALGILEITNPQGNGTLGYLMVFMALLMVVAA